MDATAGDLEPDDERLRATLARLGDRVAPLTLARERLVPVGSPMDELFVEGGIIRGQVVSCQGAAATSLALALVREAMIEGSWLAVIDVAGLGVDAADELGLPLERLVRIDTDPSPAAVADRDDGQRDDGDLARRVERWAEVVAATVDGFDLVITRPPEGVHRSTPATVRNLSSRLRRRGAVVVVLGEAGAVPVDVTVSSTRSDWVGLGRGSGLLRRRRVDVEATGRRQPGVRRCSIELVGGHHGVELVAARGAVTEIGDHRGSSSVLDDPQEQVLREMCAELDAREPDVVPGLDDHREAG